MERIRKKAEELRPSELRVLAEVLQAKRSEEIGAMLGLTKKTVEVHVDNIGKRLECGRVELVRVFCYDLADDEALFESLHLRMNAYNSARADSSKRPMAKKGQRRTDAR